jgi:hypothetical protein
MLPQKGTVNVLIYKAGDLSDITKPIDYSVLDITEYDSPQDQLLVIREFDTSTVPELVSSPLSIEEKRTAFVLPNLGTSGSPMYSVDPVNQNITFSSTLSDYTWEDVNHHGRGSDIQFPIASTNDTILITKKTALIAPRIVWEPEDVIKSKSLNSNVDHILQQQKEWNIRIENWEYFDTAVATKGGTVPLNALSIVPDSYFPSGISGDGTYEANLEGTRFETFKDVRDTMAEHGWIFEYQTSDALWTPRVMFRYLADTGDAVEGGVLRRTGFGAYPDSKWTASLYKLHYLDQIFARRDAGEHYQPKTAEIIQFIPADNQFKLAGIDADFTQPTYDGWVLQWNTATNKWEANSTIIDEVPVFDWTTEFYYLADFIDVNNNWVTFPDGTDWTNRPSFMSSENTWTGIPQSVLGYNGTTDKWEAMPYNTHRSQNVWSGSATSDTSDPGYTGGFIGTNYNSTDELWKYYKIGDVLWWEPALYQKNQDPATEDPKGSWKVGPLFEWDDVITADKVTSSTSRGDEDDPESELGILAFDEDSDRLRIKSFSLDMLTNMKKFTPRPETFLMFDAATDNWVPYEVDTGEEIYNKTIYSAKLEHHVVAGGPGGGDFPFLQNTGWTDDNIVRRIHSYDIFMPVNGTITGYKILDWADAMWERSIDNPWPEPAWNNNYDPDIPWHPLSALYPFIRDPGDGWPHDDPPEDYFNWILSMVIDITRVRPNYTNQTESLSSIASNKEATDSSAEWVSVSKDIEVGDVVRVSLDGGNYGGDHTPYLHWHHRGTRLKYGNYPPTHWDLWASGIFNQNGNTTQRQIAAATVLLRFAPEPHSH